MAQTKAQLIGGLGISTAQSLVVGSGVTINASGINVSGIISATSFIGTVTGTATGLTGTPNINVGVATATSFVGNLTGTATTASNLSDAANITTGTINSARLSGSYSINITGTASTASFATTSFGLSGNPSITVNALTATSAVVGSGVTINSSGVNASGIVTASSFRGDGSLLTGLGGGGASITVLTSNTTLSKGNAYMLNASGLVLTLPASPSTGDAIDILNNVVGIHTVARNGSTIKGLAEDMQVSQQGSKFKIWYTGSTWSLF